MFVEEKEVTVLLYNWVSVSIRFPFFPCALLYSFESSASF